MNEQKKKNRSWVFGSKASNKVVVICIKKTLYLNMSLPNLSSGQPCKLPLLAYVAESFLLIYIA